MRDIELDGALLRTEKEWHAGLAHQLEFMDLFGPGYGANPDALWDVLGYSTGGFRLTWHNVEASERLTGTDTVRILIEVMNDIIENSHRPIRTDEQRVELVIPRPGVESICWQLRDGRRIREHFMDQPATTYIRTPAIPIETQMEPTDPAHIEAIQLGHLISLNDYEADFMEDHPAFLW